MFGPPPLQAFLFGILSACSLPLGALTARAIQPREQFVAILLALGSGALLAALTIDLVGSALDREQFWALALGATLGGVAFVSLDQLIDRYGGFLRKSSTTRDYINSRRQQRFKRILSHMGRIDIFRDLPAEEAQKLADTAIYRTYAAGTALYYRNDPSKGLYVIESGQVELRDPDQEMQPIHHLTEGDAFGRMAFFAGAPHATEAVTIADTQVWILPRRSFYQLLKSSQALATAVQSFLHREEMQVYLTQRHHLPPKAAEDWESSAIASLQAGESVPRAVADSKADEGFSQVVDYLRSIALFDQLSEDDLKPLADRAFQKSHEKGYTFFHQQEPASRIHVLKRGEVALIDPQNQMRQTGTLSEYDAFGVMSFLTNASHTATAIAITDTQVWVLRKQDFEDLLLQSQSLRQAVKAFIQQDSLVCYLKERHQLDSRQADQWMQQTMKRLNRGKLIPSPADVAAAAQAHHGAPIAIWLGLLLDGIPESLVIGANLLSGHIGLSLIAGLFLSNYPEALSSSVGMERQGIAFHIIFAMWLSLMLITGGGALLGNVLLEDASAFWLSLMQGLAAGSMLTMLAETMLPEAYLKGGSMIGLSTLAGFLVAIFLRTLE